MFSQEQFATTLLQYFSTAAFLFGIYFTSFATFSVVFCVRGKSHQKTPEEIAKEEWEEEVDEALVYSNATIRVTQKMQKVGPHKIEPVPGSIKVYMKPRQRSSSSTNGIRELSTSASTSTTKSSRKVIVFSRLSSETYRSGESRNSDGDVKSDESTENTELKFRPTRPKPRLHDVASFKSSEMKSKHREPRSRKLRTTKITTTSQEQILPSSAPSSNESIQKEAKFKYSILTDQNNYATDIIESLKLSITEEVYRTRISNPHQKKLLTEDEKRIGELCVFEMRSKLEGLTKKNNIPWICYGRVRNEKTWIVDGFENLNDTHANLILSVKIIIEEPISLVLIGCKVNHNISSCSSLTPIPPQMSSEDKIQPFTPTDSNASQRSNPLIPSKRSQYSQSSASETPTVEIILPSRNRQTTVISRESDTKKTGTPTSFQTPPWQTSPPIAPTPTPETTVTTAKSCTPISAPTKTTTGISHALAQSTTQSTTPSTKITRTKSSRKILHGKKTPNELEK